MSNAAATPAIECLLSIAKLQPADIRDAAGDGRGGGHGWTHQVSEPCAPLPSFEIAIGRRRTSLTRSEHVIVHRKAHGTSRLAPFKSRGDQLRGNAFRLCLVAHRARPRHDHSAYPRIDFTT